MNKEQLKYKYNWILANGIKAKLTDNRLLIYISSGIVICDLLDSDLVEENVVILNNDDAPISNDIINTPEFNHASLLSTFQKVGGKEVLEDYPMFITVKNAELINGNDRSFVNTIDIFLDQIEGVSFGALTDSGQ